MQKNCITPLSPAEKSFQTTFKKRTPIIMKSLFFACLIGSAGIVQATNAYAQTTTISLNVENLTVGEILQQIEEKTDFSFFYNNRHVDLNRRVSVSMDETNIFNILDAIFTNTDVVYKVVDKRIVLTRKDESYPSIQQATKKITGTILDDDGTPVIGANVMVKGTTNGTITDMNGKFSLDVEEGAVLQISYIGYANQEITVGNQNNLSIALKEDAEALDELVVIGYGTARKIDLTGSTSSLGGEKLQMRNSPQLSSQLQGQMAGVQITRSSGDPSAGATIRVRGVTTLSTNDPLIIIDGVPGEINDVAPEDVKDIQVLKDAASAAIYGSRAAAGVVLITTKRAKNKDFHLSYNVEYGIDAPTAVPKFANAVQWMTGYNELAYNDGASSLNSAYSEDLINNYAQLRAENPDLYPDTDF